MVTIRGLSSSCRSLTAFSRMNAAYTSAQTFDGYQEGYSNSDTNPTSTNGNQWDYLPQTASEVEQSPQNVQGGFGQGYQQTTITPALLTAQDLQNRPCWSE